MLRHEWGLAASPGALYILKRAVSILTELRDTTGSGADRRSVQLENGGDGERDSPSVSKW